MAELPADRVVAVWLTAGDEVLRDRIRRTSLVEELAGAPRLAVEKFIGRTVGYQARLIAEIDRLGLTRIDAGEPTAVPHVVTRIRHVTGADAIMGRSGFG